MTYLDILKDFPWWIWVIHIILYPLYQIIGTLKHEGAHALGAKRQGLRIVEFKYLPSRIDGRWYWGYVRFTGEANKTTLLMPYYVDATLFFGGIIAFMNREEFWAQRTAWLLPCMILTLALPIVDVIYNLGKWLFGNRGDFAKAFKDL